MPFSTDKSIQVAQDLGVLEVQDESVSQATNIRALNFIGAGVAASVAGGVADITIASGDAVIFGSKYVFSTNTSSGPASGELRFNNADPSLTTQIYVHETDRNAANASGLLDFLQLNSVIAVIDESDPSIYNFYDLTNQVDNGTDRTYDVTFLYGQGTPAGNVTLGASVRGPQGLTGDDGAAGLDGVSGFGTRHTFSGATSFPPANGELRFNNATPSLATSIYVSDTDRNSAMTENVLAEIDTESCVMVIDENDFTSYAFYRVTSRINHVNYQEYVVVHLASSGTIVGEVTFSFAKAGPQGPSGTTDLAVANLTDSTLDVTSSTGADTTLPQAVAATSAGLMSGTDKAKLDGIAPAAGPPHIIEDEGVPLAQRDALNFIGTNVTVTDNAGTDATDITVEDINLGTGSATDTTLEITNTGGNNATLPQAVASTSAGLLSGTDKAKLDGVAANAEANPTIEDEGVALTKRPTLDFQGAGVSVTDDAVNNQTVVTIPGGGGGSAIEVENNGTSLTTGATKLNFIPGLSGITITEPVADEIEIDFSNVQGGSSGGSGSPQLIQRIEITAATQSTVTFSSIPQDYEHLQIKASLRTEIAAIAEGINLVINGETTDASYKQTQYSRTGTLEVYALNDNRSIGVANGSTAASGSFALNTIDFPFYSSTDRLKIAEGKISGYRSPTEFQASERVVVKETSNAAIGSIGLESTSNFSVGCVFELWGISETGGSNGGSGGAGAWEFVEEVTATGGELVLEFSGLSGDDYYFIEGSALLTTNNFINIYVNGQLPTGTNYRGSQTFNNAGNVQASSTTTNRITFTESTTDGASFFYNIVRGQNNTVSIQGQASSDRATFDLNTLGSFSDAINPVSDITSIHIGTEGGALFAAGSQVRLYKLTTVTGSSGGGSGGSEAETTILRLDSDKAIASSIQTPVFDSVIGATTFGANAATAEFTPTEAGWYQGSAVINYTSASTATDPTLFFITTHSTSGSSTAETFRAARADSEIFAISGNTPWLYFNGTTDTIQLQVFANDANTLRGFASDINWSYFSLTKMSTGGGGGSALEIEDTGSSLTTGATKINFVTGSSGVVLSEPATDEIQVDFSGIGGGSGLNVQAPITADPSSALANSIYLLDSSGGSFNVTLPPGNDGDVIQFGDHVGTSLSSPTGLGLNSVTIIPDGSDTIQGQTNLVLNVDNQSVKLAKFGTRWSIIG